jgi:hypothetical protein
MLRELQKIDNTGFWNHHCEGEKQIWVNCFLTVSISGNGQSFNTTIYLNNSKNVDVTVTNLTNWKDIVKKGKIMLRLL